MSEPGPGVGAGPSWGLAVTAFIAAVTSILSPWWGLVYRVEGAEGSARDAVRLFRDHGLVEQTFTIMSGALVIVAVFLLFLRIAARSWWYEPAAWTRDIAIAGALLLAAAAITLLWPDAHPHFWGTIEYQSEQGFTYTESARPFLGWYAAVLGGVLALATLRHRPKIT